MAPYPLPLVVSLVLTTAASAQPAAPLASERERACLALVRSAPARAAEEAARWRLEGGGVPARRCLGLALAAEGKPGAARAEFEGAARAAALANDPGTARLWAMAGNAAMGAGDFPGARVALDQAIAVAPGAGESAALRAGLHTDRAGVAMALGDTAAAGADLDRAIALNPADPQARLLAAKLARGRGDLAAARDQISTARRLAPGDAEIEAESALIGALMADSPAARAAEPGVRVTPY
jgi:tetratricopeptide (TPR) repeat protein